jgi:hypothetical protein
VRRQRHRQIITGIRCHGKLPTIRPRP